LSWLARRAYASKPVLDEKVTEERADFKSQLWESTTERVQREREEQARYAKQRQLGSGGSGIAFTAGFTPHYRIDEKQC